MKIGIVCYPTFGGSGVVATELGHGLAARGHEVHLVSYAPPVRFEGFDERIRHHEVEVSSYPLFRYPPYDLALTSRLAEVAEQAELDLVHVHYAIPHTIAALVVKDVIAPRPFPVVTTLHGTDITIVGQDPSYRRITRYAIRKSDAVTSVSEYLRRETDRVFKVDRHIEVIPNFVDPDRFRPDVPPQIHTCFSPRGEKVVIHVSNFRPVKRAVKAVEAFARIQERLPACLLMVGDGPERGACEARARELGLRGNIRFLGAQADVETILPVADLMLMPSEYESFGLAALEAMSCEVVPVATAAGGLPEVIESGVDGLLVPEAEIDAMGDYAAELLADEPLLAAMKKAARETVVERFHVDVVVPRYEALYEEVTGNR